MMRDRSMATSRTVWAGLVASLILALGYLHSWLQGQPVDVLTAIMHVLTVLLPTLAAIGIRGAIGRIIWLLAQMASNKAAK